jgi:2-oxoisovalerate dehydrogenase E1 component
MHDRDLVTRTGENTMAIKKELKASSSWVHVSTTPADWKSADPRLLETMLVELHVIRAFEETVLELSGAGLVHGPAHSSIGQEGGAVGSVAGLRPTDGINGSHRGHHQFLAKVLGYLRPDGFKASEKFSTEVQVSLQKSLAEILGLAQGYCRGRGGSMHLQWMEAGALGTNAIVGGGAPLATGNAWAQKNSNTTDITVTYFGDGAVNIGSVLESMNLAAAWKLPICFFIENNRYAVSTKVEEATGEPRLSARGLGFNVPSWQVDGMDPLAVHLAMSEAAEHMRSGKGPTIIEAEVYRYFHQNGAFPGSAFGYRSKEEEASWRARDPLDRVGNEMKALGLIDDEMIASLRSNAQEAMSLAAAALTEQDPEAKAGVRRIRPGLWPSTEFVDVGIRGDLSELEGARTRDVTDPESPMKIVKFVDAVAGVMDRRMSEEENIVVLGEDVHRLNGGTNGATKGLAKKFPHRILGTPISENAFLGLGGGMALDGRFKPVVEFMYADFMWVAADQVFNQVGKARHMFGGDNPVPLVLRSKVAMGSGYGSQHSMDPAGIYATNPGWRIVAPSTPFDYIGLMNTALALNDPVLVIEHVDLYSTTGEVPVDDFDYQLPFGKAALRRVGNDITIISYLSMVNHVVEAVDIVRADADVIDLRWLDRASVDWEAIGESVRKTNNVLIAEQGARGTSYGGWMADEIQRRFFDWLDQPVQRVTGGEASPSISKVLERAAGARTEEVVEGIKLVLASRGKAN